MGALWATAPRRVDLASRLHLSGAKRADRHPHAALRGEGLPQLQPIAARAALGGGHLAVDDQLQPAQRVDIGVELRHGSHIQARTSSDADFLPHPGAVDREVQQRTVGHEHAAGAEGRVPGVRIERAGQLDVVTLDAGQRRPEERIVRPAGRVHLETQVQERVPGVGHETPALQHLDEVHEVEGHVNRQAAASVEELAHVRVARDATLLVRGLEDLVVGEEILRRQVDRAP